MDDPKGRLRAATMTQADKFQLHIYAALAEQERDFISARTEAALKAARARREGAGRSAIPRLDVASRSGGRAPARPGPEAALYHWAPAKRRANP